MNERRYMTEQEKRRAAALSPFKIKYPPGTMEKRFARHMCALASSTADPLITERQAAWLFQLAWKYRRQIPSSSFDVIPASKPEKVH